MILKPRTPKQFKTNIDNIGRVCTKCLKYKPWNNYAKVSIKKTITGRASSCIKCALEKRKALGRPKEKEYFCAKKRREELKQINPLLARARRLRQNLLTRASSPELKATTPSTEKLLEWLKNNPNPICYYSGVPLNLLKKNMNRLTIDHKTPIGKGGTNELGNLCFASHHMNSAKGAMNEIEFKQLLSLIYTWEDKGKKLLSRLKQGHY